MTGYYFKNKKEFFLDSPQKKGDFLYDIDIHSSYDALKIIDTVIDCLMSNSFKKLCSLRGVFSGVVFHEKSQKIWLFSDFFGYSPLYYKLENENIYFSNFLKKISEKTKLKTAPQNKAEFLTRGFNPRKQTLYENTWRVPPATVVEIEEGVDKNISYYNPNIQKNKSNLKQNIDSLKKIVDLSLKESVGNHDEINIFYSGGIDSTLLLNRCLNMNKKIKLYSIVFNEKNYSEKAFQHDYIKDKKVDYKEIVLTPKKYADKLHNIIENKKEKSFILTQDVPAFSALADECFLKGKNVLMGLPADEWFFGYKYMTDFYYDCAYYNNIITEIGVDDLKKVLNNSGGIFAIILNEFIQNISNIRSIFNRYFTEEEIKKITGENYFDKKEIPFSYEKIEIKKMLQLIQYKVMLPNNYFVRLNTIENISDIKIMLPYMHKELFEFALSLDEDFLFKGGKQKYLLYEAVKGEVPESIFNRRKHGFEIPLKSWLYKDDFSFIKECLIKNSGLLNVDSNYIKKLYKNYEIQKIWYLFSLINNLI
ncbi:MAG: asparagine synthase-related protein [Candidatus Muiribacteriota bacterium]